MHHFVFGFWLVTTGHDHVYMTVRKPSSNVTNVQFLVALTQSANKYIVMTVYFQEKREVH